MKPCPACQQTDSDDFNACPGYGSRLLGLTTSGRGGKFDVKVTGVKFL
jgi:hypothetical protein